ncbi:MAG TPA: serine/threonine-protein kinase, partial [Kofleriaceae bacterium]|nr:serine/threonine-protein kinase [Kofleriaceae bacterium]
MNCGGLFVTIALVCIAVMRVCISCRSLLGASARQCPADGAATVFVKTLPKDTRLGAYKIDRMLGEGGMGLVYEATHEVLNRRAAIKMLRPELSAHSQMVTRFLNEAKAVNLIDHQNIVNVYDYGDNLEGSIYFVMEFLAGETLEGLMRERRPMQVPLLLHVFGQVARALAAAHAKQIVHRDLKPANVYVVTREDNPYFIKLLDFGVAQLRGAGAPQGLTVAGTVMGTPQYMSPEQISGGTVDARSDVWAMGVMMYRAATGQAPFKGEKLAEIADKIRNHAPQPADEIVALPAALCRLITRCLERRVEARCPSVAELIAGLEQVKQEWRLDDDAILAAVTADAGTIIRSAPELRREPTRDILAGSVPRDQGASARVGLRPGAGWSRLGRYATIAAAAFALGSAAYLMLGRGEDLGPQAAAQPSAIASMVAVGDLDAARRHAEHDLRDVIASGTLQQQGIAVDALGLARV